MVSHFIEKVDDGLTKREIENLIAGESVAREIHQELTYNRLYDSIENIWSVLFMTGYLTQRGTSEGDMFQLAIPNREIRKIFTDQVMDLFKEREKYARRLYEEGMRTVLFYGIACYQKECRVMCN